MLFCHSLPCFIFFFYQDYSFTQLIQVFTFNNKPDIAFVHYKLEIYIVGVEISGKNNFKKKCTFNKIPISFGIRGPVLKHPVIFYIIFFLATLQKCTSRCIYHIGLQSYLVQTKLMNTKSSDSFVYTTNYPYQFG